MSTFYIYKEDYLAHHGVLGMKWGVRKYENADGTLTSAGRKRYLEGKDGNNIKGKIIGGALGLVTPGVHPKIGAKIGSAIADKFAKPDPNKGKQLLKDDLREQLNHDPTAADPDRAIDKLDKKLDEIKETELYKSKEYMDNYKKLEQEVKKLQKIWEDEGEWWEDVSYENAEVYAARAQLMEKKYLDSKYKDHNKTLKDYAIADLKLRTNTEYGKMAEKAVEEMVSDTLEDIRDNWYINGKAMDLIRTVDSEFGDGWYEEDIPDIAKQKV